MHPSLPAVTPPRTSRPLKAFALLVVASLSTAAFAETLAATGAAPSGESNFITLTDTGGDRATAYAMSNKIVRRDGKYLSLIHISSTRSIRSLRESNKR